MAVPYYGDFAEDDTVNIPFNTFSSDDPSKSCTITELADGDIKVYKDGNTDEIVTDGATVVINFDTHTGAHMITIDTSADAAYSTGSEYAVLIDGTVIDAATDMDMWIGTFSIERAGGVLALLKATLDVNVTSIAADVITPASIDEDADFVIQALSITNALDAGSFAVDGALTVGDGIAVTCSTDSKAAIKATGGATAGNGMELIGTGTGIDLKADVTGNITGNVSGTVAGKTPAEVGDLGTVQSGDSYAIVNGDHGLVSIQDDIDAILTDTGTTLENRLIAIEADTNELQTDWANDGRLDLILDAAGGAGDPWITELPGAYGAGTAGKIIGDNINAPIGTVDTVVDDIKTAVITNAAGVDIAADIIAMKAETATIVNDTDVIDDATSGLVKIASDVAAILTDTGTTIPGTITTAQNDLDIITGATGVNLLAATQASIDAIETDTGTTLDTNITAIKAVTDVLTAAAATKLALSAGTIVTGTVSHDNTAASTTVFYSDDITEATADHFNGRIVIFTSGALQYQATSISDYALDTGEGKFTVVALTESPADNVTFIIV